MLKPVDNKFRTTRSLDGFWDYRFDREVVGRRDKWFDGFVESGECGESVEKSSQGLLAVPASWNEIFSDMDDAYFLDECWYARRHFVPAQWSDRRIVLRVGSVSYRAEVWVNGCRAGEHEGCHLPFEFDVTDLIRPDAENLIVIAVNARLSPQTLPIGELGDQSDAHSTLLKPYPNVNFDFFPYGGIHRPVVLYTTSKSYFDSLAVETSVNGPDATVSISADVNAPDGGEVVFEIDGRAASATVNSGRASAEIAIENARLWSCQDPHLYQLNATLSVDACQCDSYTMNIGVRTVEVSGDKILLNGEPVYMRGFGKHEDFPVIGKGLNHAVILKDYELMRWIGANSYRTTHYPYSEEMLDIADRLGFLVVSETPAVGLVFDYDTSELMAKHKIVTEELIKRDRNHPSVIMWCLANEPRSDQEASRPYFTELLEYARALDNTRPFTVVTCDGPWVARGECNVMDLCDVICLNRYYGWYVGAGRIGQAVENFRIEMQEIHDRCGKPIIITEFGADCVEGQHSLPSFVFSEEYQSELLEKSIEMLESLPFCAGEHIWNFADFMTGQVHSRVVGNRKGVFTRNRQPKMAAHTVRRLWSSPWGDS